MACRDEDQIDALWSIERTEHAPRRPDDELVAAADAIALLVGCSPSEVFRQKGMEPRRHLHTSEAMRARRPLEGKAIRFIDQHGV